MLIHFRVCRGFNFLICFINVVYIDIHAVTVGAFVNYVVVDSFDNFGRYESSNPCRYLMESILVIMPRRETIVRDMRKRLIVETFSFRWRYSFYNACRTFTYFILVLIPLVFLTRTCRVTFTGRYGRHLLCGFDSHDFDRVQRFPHSTRVVGSPEFPALDILGILARTDCITFGAAVTIQFYPLLIYCTR